MDTRDNTISKIGIAILTKVRGEDCPHSIPQCVLAEDTPIFDKGTLITPLCDACVMGAIREILANYKIEVK